MHSPCDSLLTSTPNAAVQHQHHSRSENWLLTTSGESTWKWLACNTLTWTEVDEHRIPPHCTCTPWEVLVHASGFNVRVLLVGFRALKKRSMATLRAKFPTHWIGVDAIEHGTYIV